MNAACLFLAAGLLAADPPAPLAKAEEKLQALHLAEAGKWQMYLDASHTVKAALHDEPVYIWTNPTRSHGQHGSVFVWTHGGRPVVVGSIFSHPELGRRMICQEFHSLAASELFPERGADDQRWEPKGSVGLAELPDAPIPEASAGRRLIQVRLLSREFTAHSVDFQKERWTLRLLPQPIYRYDRPEGDVVDGALLAFVTSAGTDPEVVLALEARKTSGGLAWHYRAIRFSDSNLYVQHRGKEVWSSVRDDQNQLHFNPDHTYRLIRDKSIDELPELVITDTN
jgi:hypothetical protein